MKTWTAVLALALAFGATAAELPAPVEGGFNLPNGWRITPIGKAVDIEDTVLDATVSPDGRTVIAVNGGFADHGMVVIDPAAEEAVQRIAIPTVWHGLAWNGDGSRLFVAGGNSRNRRAPVWVFEYKDARVSEKPTLEILDESLPPDQTFWAGLAHQPKANVLYAASQVSGEVVAFDSETGAVRGRVKVENSPYDLALSADGSTLYCSNWSSDSVSIIDTGSLGVIGAIVVGDNPSDLLLARDGRLYVACANDNSVVVVDTAAKRAVETIQTTMYERAPEGSTPNALALDPKELTLYVANGDNNNVCVVDIAKAGKSNVLGFIPAGWYPSALAVTADGSRLCIANSKGAASSSNVQGPNSPLPGSGRDHSVKALMAGTVNLVHLDEVMPKLAELTQQCLRNSPYSNELLSLAKPSASGASVVPREVGAGSPIKHILYIIKENRTYDQVLGDVSQGNGDPRICIFGRAVTPNHHTIVDQFVLLDNLYCDAEVSRDGHQWSNAAYATDYVEKTWPMSYGGKGNASRVPAELPGAGYIWDQCARKGLTYRSYGEQAQRVSEGTGPMVAINAGLVGHLCEDYYRGQVRDTENAKAFIREFDEFETNFDNPDPDKRLPNFMVMSLPENHTHGTRPGTNTPRACVANNDYALGLILERVTHSRYWPEMAVFVIEDDAQDGADHVDARRTVGLVASPYSRLKAVDSTLYTTSSMLRTMELLLGLPPMSQYDAAANPMYACFRDTRDESPYDALKPQIDVDEMNMQTAWGADASMKMDFSDVDRTPMFALNEIIWKSVRGAESEMPLPVHRYHWAAFDPES